MSVPRLRAPKEHGGLLAVPPLSQVAALLESNQRSLRDTHACPLNLAGKTLVDVRLLARKEVLELSTHYHRDAGENVPDATGPVWLMAGHQPELFHPGVWIKNFVLAHLARKHGALALNLIVDTDAAKPAVLAVPSEGQLVRVPFDHSTSDTAYEDRRVEDETLFASLPERLAPLIAKWGFEPMLPAFWREAMHQVKRTPLLGERIAGARRALERRWGIVQREVPMSQVCGTKAFAWFVCTVLRDLSRFHNIYNQSVHEYRLAHRIRSRSHPVPDLATDAGWLEAPFWAWKTGQTRRSRLFIQAGRDRWSLRVGADVMHIPAASALDGLQALQTTGVKIRPRALTMTMFARLFLADLFIHGIGGGIYDALTNQIIERYFGLPAPRYLIASATLLLPLQRFPDAATRLCELRRHLRDMTYKSELYLSGGAESEGWKQSKLDWITRDCSTHSERAERFRRIREINARIGDQIADQIAQQRSLLPELQRQSEWDGIASRRDYAFCLYPEALLAQFFTKGSTWLSF